MYRIKAIDTFLKSKAYDLGTYDVINSMVLPHSSMFAFFHTPIEKPSLRKSIRDAYYSTLRKLLPDDYVAEGMAEAIKSKPVDETLGGRLKPCNIPLFI